jgi:hypothetical protein
MRYKLIYFLPGQLIDAEQKLDESTYESLAASLCKYTMRAFAYQRMGIRGCNSVTDTANEWQVVQVITQIHHTGEWVGVVGHPGGQIFCHEAKLVADTVMAVELELSGPRKHHGIGFFGQDEKLRREPTLELKGPDQVKGQSIPSITTHAFSSVLIDPYLVICKHAIKVKSDRVDV